MYGSTIGQIPHNKGTIMNDLRTFIKFGLCCFADVMVSMWATFHPGINLYAVAAYLLWQVDQLE